MEIDNFSDKDYSPDDAYLAKQALDEPMAMNANATDVPEEKAPPPDESTVEQGNPPDNPSEDSLDCKEALANALSSITLDAAEDPGGDDTVDNDMDKGWLKKGMEESRPSLPKSIEKTPAASEDGLVYLTYTFTVDPEKYQSNNYQPIANAASAQKVADKKELASSKGASASEPKGDKPAEEQVIVEEETLGAVPAEDEAASSIVLDYASYLDGSSFLCYDEVGGIDYSTITMDAAAKPAASKPNCKTTFAQCRAKNPLYCRFHGPKLLEKDIKQALNALLGKNSCSIAVTKDKASKNPLTFRLTVGCVPEMKDKVEDMVHKFLTQNPGIKSAEDWKDLGSKGGKKMETTEFDMDILQADKPPKSSDWALQALADTQEAKEKGKKQAIVGETPANIEAIAKGEKPPMKDKTKPQPKPQENTAEGADDADIDEAYQKYANTYQEKYGYDPHLNDLKKAFNLELVYAPSTLGLYKEALGEDDPIYQRIAEASNLLELSKTMGKEDEFWKVAKDSSKPAEEKLSLLNSIIKSPSPDSDEAGKNSVPEKTNENNEKQTLDLDKEIDDLAHENLELISSDDQVSALYYAAQSAINGLDLYKQGLEEIEAKYKEFEGSEDGDLSASGVLAKQALENAKKSQQGAYDEAKANAEVSVKDFKAAVEKANTAKLDGIKGKAAQKANDIIKSTVHTMFSNGRPEGVESAVDLVDELSEELDTYAENKLADDGGSKSKEVVEAKKKYGWAQAQLSVYDATKSFDTAVSNFKEAIDGANTVSSANELSEVQETLTNHVFEISQQAQALKDSFVSFKSKVQAIKNEIYYMSEIKQDEKKLSKKENTHSDASSTASTDFSGDLAKYTGLDKEPNGKFKSASAEFLPALHESVSNAIQQDGGKFGNVSFGTDYDNHKLNLTIKKKQKRGFDEETDIAEIPTDAESAQIETALNNELGKIGLKLDYGSASANGPELAWVIVPKNKKNKPAPSSAAPKQEADKKAMIEAMSTKEKMEKSIPLLEKKIKAEPNNEKWQKMLKIAKAYLAAHAENWQKMMMGAKPNLAAHA